MFPGNLMGFFFSLSVVWLKNTIIPDCTVKHNVQNVLYK